MSRRTGVALAAGLAVVAVLVATLGGGPIGDGTASGGSTTAPAPTTVPIAEEDRPFCQAFGALLVGPLSDPSVDISDPAVLREAASATVAVLAEMAATAPAELVEPAGVVAEQYGAAIAVFERYGYDLDRVQAEATPDDQAVLDAFGAPGTPADEALVPIESWVADHCATDALPDLDDD